jgi:TRAP-type C4-dicarboxylate transport system permease small subunit
VLAFADRLLSRAEEVFVGAALAFSAILLFVNVLLRYWFLAPISWAEELSLYLVVWIVFVGASVATRARGHIAIDLLALALSAANRRRLSLGAGVLVLVFLAFFTYYSAGHTARIHDSGQLTPVMLAPMWLAYLAMPAGGALMFLRAFQVWWRVYRMPTRGGPAMDLQD